MERLLMRHLFKSRPSARYIRRSPAYLILLRFDRYPLLPTALQHKAVRPLSFKSLMLGSIRGTESLW